MKNKRKSLLLVSEIGGLNTILNRGELTTMQPITELSWSFISHLRSCSQHIRANQGEWPRQLIIQIKIECDEVGQPIFIRQLDLIGSDLDAERLV